MCIYLEKKLSSYKDHLKSYEDLITTYNETRAGFISIALEKNRRATPIVEEARALQLKIKNIKNPNDLINFVEIRNGIIAASGISEKASKHLGDDGCNDAIKEFVKNFLIPAGEKFKEELVFRFLLTKGDSLGGSMRNIVGALSQKKVNSSIIASFNLSNIKFEWFHETTKSWIQADKSNYNEAIDYAKGLFWKNKNKSRIIYYNITVPIVKNNIDIILLNSKKDEDIKSLIDDTSKYIALGELKGGIDPAGADEHWKTAKTAIDRISNAFKKKDLNPKLFYIGAAIENKMATEIWSLLKTGYIANAANLTNNDHIASLVDWLITL